MRPSQGKGLLPQPLNENIRAVAAACRAAATLTSPCADRTAASAGGGIEPRLPRKPFWSDARVDQLRRTVAIVDYVGAKTRVWDERK